MKMYVHSLTIRALVATAVIAGCSSNKAPTPPSAEAAEPGLDSDTAEQVEKEYDVDVTESNTVSFNAVNTLFSQDISLDDVKEANSIDFVQIDREMVTRTFKQGAAGIAQTENFVQGQYTGLIDVLFVVDTTSGMSTEQDLLKVEWNSVVSAISGADWRVASVTMDSADSCLRSLLQKGDVFLSSKFSSAIGAGTGGSSSERGIARAKAALSCSTASWVRPGSFVAVVFFTTEDNCGVSGGECAGETASQPAALTSYITNTMARTIGTDAKFYGLYWKPGTSCSTGVEEAVQYEQLVTGSGGISRSVCSSSYTSAVTAMSTEWSKGLKAQIALKETPDAGSLVVKVNGVVSSGYTLNGNVVTFDPKPAIGATIEASYKTGSGEQVKNFDLASDPAVETIKVTVNAAEVASTDYTVDLARQRLTLAAAPPPSADIQITFRKNVALKTTFDIGQKVDAKTLKVSVNGTETADYTFDAATGIVTFNAPPPDAGTVKAAFVRHISPILDYVVSGAVSVEAVLDAETQDPVTFVFQGETLSVDPAEHTYDRKITVLYKDTNSNASEIVLPHTPIPESLVIETAEDCSLGSGITLEGNKLILSCDIQGDGVFVVSYEYHPPKAELSFKIAEATKPDAGIWSVSINGVPTENYVRSGNVITLNEQPDVNSKILISFEPN
jgi:hypothetical protein